MSEPVFLDLEDVLSIHSKSIERFGGLHGLRDGGLLASAVAQPRASFGGSLLHDGLFAQAAAYLFHIVKNHPFVDGNKRTGLGAALVFLEINDVHTGDDDLADDELIALTLAVAEGRSGRADVADTLERRFGRR